MLAPREVDEYVLPTERRVIRFRRHWAVIVGEVLQAVILFVLLALGAAFLPQNVVLDNLFWYGALLVLLKSSYKVSEWWVEKVVVTDKRVMLTKGIFTHNVGMMPLTQGHRPQLHPHVQRAPARLRDDGHRVGRPDPGAQPDPLPARPRRGLRGDLRAGVRRQAPDPLVHPPGVRVRWGAGSAGADTSASRP